MQKTLAIAIAQPLVIPGDVTHNLSAMRPLVAEAKNRGADLILFSETGLTGYDLRGAAVAAAIGITDPAIDSISEMAVQQNIAIVTGFYERDAACTYNTAVACLPDGRRIRQRKHAIWGTERDELGVTPDLTEHTIFAYNGFRIAILICADNGLPDINATIAKRGCDLILAPTAGCGDVKYGFSQAELAKPDRREAYLRASESVCFISPAPMLEHDIAMACVNQAGYIPSTGYFHPGHGAVIDRTGEITALIPGRFVFEHLRPQLAVGFVSLSARPSVPAGALA